MEAAMGISSAPGTLMRSALAFAASMRASAPATSSSAIASWKRASITRSFAPSSRASVLVLDAGLNAMSEPIQPLAVLGKPRDIARKLVHFEVDPVAGLEAVPVGD